jgi:hypothetical protein
LIIRSIVIVPYKWQSAPIRAIKHPAGHPSGSLYGHQDETGLGAGVGTEALRNAPIRSGFEKVRANYSRKVMVESKGFVGPALHFP